MSTESKLKSLFDFQRFEQESKLQGVIDEVNSSYSSGNRLDDDALELVAGGEGAVNTDTDNTMFREFYCEKCRTIRKFKMLSGGRAICTQPGCGNMIDGK